jgi:hypothetical protein
MQIRSEWKCKVGICIVAYSTKWLLTKHLKEVHGLIAKKAKPRKLSTFERGTRHQDHAKMNVCMLRNVMVVQRWSDQKVTNPAFAKTQHEWDK